MSGRDAVDVAAAHNAAALLLAAARVDPTLRAAAERVQDALLALGGAEPDPSVPQPRDDPEEIRARIAALTAPAPQPADPADTATVGDRLGKAWLDAQESVADGGCRAPAPGGVWVCTRSAHGTGQHIATLGSRVVAVWSAAPRPAEMTRHGHPIPGVTVAGHARPTAVARCGGPALCTQCALDVERATGSDEDSPAVAAPAVPAAVEVDARCTLGDLARNVAQLWRRDRAAADGQPMLVGRTYQGELWTALNQLAAAYVDAGAPQPAVPDEEDTP